MLVYTTYLFMIWLRLTVQGIDITPTLLYAFYKIHSLKMLITEIVKIKVNITPTVIDTMTFCITSIKCLTLTALQNQSLIY